MGIEDYTPIVGRQVVNELQHLAHQFEGLTIQTVSSTAEGGGVAEILNRMLPLLLDLGVEARWDVIQGDERFFDFTKKLHNAVHGIPETFTAEDYQAFTEVTQANLDRMELRGDIMFIHDPQPIGLVKARNEVGGHWAWRCHVDVSAPVPEAWDFLRPYIEAYDAVVVSAPTFARPISTRQALIAPSIDPLSPKNREIDPAEVPKILERFGIDPQRPTITQISRFDYLKDPVGVIEVFRLVRRYVDCQLVLAGGGATDDPEGAKVLAEVEDRAAGDPNIHILFLPPHSDLEINALQRAATVVVQKSLREGFGLTVTEALWKAKPVVASAVGGIPLQIAHRHSGLLSTTIEGTAYCVRQLLNDPDYGRRLGENGREQVRQNFLITRHLRDYLLLFLSLLHPQQTVYL